MLGMAHAVVVGAVAVGTVDRPLEASFGERVARGVQRDVVASPDQSVRDETHDQLGPAVGVRRDALIGRRELGDAQSGSPAAQPVGGPARGDDGGGRS